MALLSGMIGINAPGLKEVAALINQNSLECAPIAATRCDTHLLTESQGLAIKIWHPYIEIENLLQMIGLMSLDYRP